MIFFTYIHMYSILLQQWVEGKILHWEWNSKAANSNIRRRCGRVVLGSIILAFIVFVLKQPLSCLVVVLECTVQIPVRVTALSLQLVDSFFGVVV